MNIYYLYVKTSLNTGLKYLGYTKKNPYVYKGSGKYWQRHLKKHGDNVWTNIVHQSSDINEIKNMGVYLSEKWDVVASDAWANLIVETTTGADTSQYIDYITSAKKRKDNNNRWQQTDEQKENHRKHMS